MINEDVRPCKVLSFFQRFYQHFSFENSQHCYETPLVPDYVE